MVVYNHLSKALKRWGGAAWVLAMLPPLVLAAPQAPSVALRQASPFPTLATAAGGTLTLQLAVDLLAPVTAPLTVTLAVTDADGAPVFCQEKPVTAELPGTTANLAFAFPPPSCGWYDGNALAKDATGRTLATLAIGMAAVPAPVATDGRNSFFGMNTHILYPNGETVVLPSLLRLAGIRWVRDAACWGQVEKTAGQYQIPPLYTQYLSALRSYGIHSLALLAYDNVPVHPSVTQGGAKAYGNYAQFVAGRLRGQVDAFEIWNEPHSFGNMTPAQYATVLHEGAAGVRRGNPDATVVGIGGASPGGWSLHFLPGVEEAGYLGDMDTFSIHPYLSPHTAEIGYRTTGSPFPLACLPDGDALTGGYRSKLVPRRGVSPRIWITEMGWPSNRCGLRAQAQQIARMYLTTAVHGLIYAHTFLYDFICDGVAPAEDEHNFGVVNRDYSIRPAFAAIAAAAQAIEGKPFLRSLPCADDSVQAHLFGTEDAPVLAVWVTELSRAEALSGVMHDGSPAAPRFLAGSAPDKRLLVTVNAPATAVVRDWQWKVLDLTPTNGVLHLPLTPWPLYVTGLSNAGAVSLAAAQKNPPGVTSAAPAPH